MSEETRFEARIDSARTGGVLLVAGELTRYSLESLRDMAMRGAGSLLIRVFDVPEAEFDEARELLCRHLTGLIRRGVTLEVVRA